MYVGAPDAIVDLLGNDRERTDPDARFLDHDDGTRKESIIDAIEAVEQQCGLSVCPTRPLTTKQDHRGPLGPPGCEQRPGVGTGTRRITFAPL